MQWLRNWGPGAMAFVLCLQGIHLHITMLHCWAKFSNVLIHSSIRMIRAKNYESASLSVNLSKLCLEYCALSFFRTRCS